MLLNPPGSPQPPALAPSVASAGLGVTASFLAVSKAPAQEVVPDVRPSVRLSVRPFSYSFRPSVCHSLFIMITTFHRNDIYMAETYGQECGIEISPYPIDQFFQEGRDKNHTPPQIRCSRDI